MKSVPVLGAAGLTFSLVGGASAAAVPTADVRRRRPLDLVIRSRSARKKSPTSAWRRSMCSTRKTRRRRRTACRSPGVVAAVAVAVAGAEVAAAVAVAVAAVVAAAVAALRGALAASAKAGCVRTTLIDEVLGRVRPCRPGQSLFCVDPCDSTISSLSRRCRQIGAACVRRRSGFQALSKKATRPNWCKEIRRAPATPLTPPRPRAARKPRAASAPRGSRRQARTFRSSRRTSPSMCCRPIGLPLLRGPQILPAWRALLRARHRDRQRRQELSRNRRASCQSSFRPTRSRKRSSG